MKSTIKPIPIALIELIPDEIGGTMVMSMLNKHNKRINATGCHFPDKRIANDLPGVIKELCDIYIAKIDLPEVVN